MKLRLQFIYLIVFQVLILLFVFGCSGRKTIYEYKVVELKVYSMDEAKIEQSLNQLGRDGWKLVGLEKRMEDYFVVFYFAKEL